MRPHYEAFRESLAALLCVPPERINLKAKGPEGLDPPGKGAAIACYCVATLLLPL